MRVNQLCCSSYACVRSHIRVAALRCCPRRWSLGLGTRPCCLWRVPAVPRMLIHVPQPRIAVYLFCGIVHRPVCGVTTLLAVSFRRMTRVHVTFTQAPVHNYYFCNTESSFLLVHSQYRVARLYGKSTGRCSHHFGHVDLTAGQAQA